VHPYNFAADANDLPPIEIFKIMNTQIQTEETGIKTNFPFAQRREASFESWDGTLLFYRAWIPEVSPTQAVLVFHRGHEHSGRLEDLIKGIALPATAYFAWDARGHGKSPGRRGYAENFATFVKDADAFARHIAAEYEVPIEKMAALGHSVGAVVAAAWVHDFAPPLCALVLGTPAFDVKLYIPFAIPALRVLKKFAPFSFVQSYVKASMLTHDREEARNYESDPLISRSIASNILIDLFDKSKVLVRDSGAIQTPTFVLSAGSDWVVKRGAQRAFFEGLSSSLKKMEVYPGFHHSIFHERERSRPISDIRNFLVKCFDSEPYNTNDILRSHIEGFTKREFEALSRPAAPLKSLNYGIQKAVLKTLGRLSAGVQIGWRTGFDSGESLDYVYRNQPEGHSIIGRTIDRAYLNSIGWVGIRQRRIHIEKTINGAIQRILNEGRPVKILDIASGPGRYLLNTIKSLDSPLISAELRDRSLTALEEGRKLASQMGLKNVNYSQGDAFNTSSLASITPKPNVAIVSGLYELFSDNDLVLASLKGLAAAMEEGGYLIYTNQPIHPDIEMIARVLINRDQKPWIMRRRTQLEMDTLVKSVGFTKVDMEIDVYGIFSVSLAVKQSTPSS
jgi:alpha-beta hydrolase superfamily lysophospholipase/SAM-dependent methyltransferase